MSRYAFKVAALRTGCFLFILLFAYAALTKALDFDNFQVQLAQSPLLTSFAGWVSYGVIATEIFLAVLLCFPRTYSLGLMGSFSLMVMFSIYIVLIMYFSPFVPCSCGGILENMGWGEHLVFNLFFTGLALAAWLWTLRGIPYIKMAAYAAVNIVISGGVVTGLFLLSEDIQHRRNNFTRRYPHHPAEFVRDVDLGCPSCYIAGASGNKVYLGDLNDPLRVIELDSMLSHQKVYHIQVKETGRRYYNLKLSVAAPDFYLSDGKAAFIYHGRLGEWKAALWMDQAAYFNAFAPIDSAHAAIRAVSSTTAGNVLGVLRRGQPVRVSLKPGILEQQQDGIFDTDGRLLYNAAHRKLLYLYTYRNSYIVSDTQFATQRTGHTIDTTTTVPIKTVYVPSLKATKLASPARIVNRGAATDQDYLYVNAGLIGQHEPKAMWEQASIIDVYDFMRHRYLFSFYLYDKKGQKVANFTISQGRVYTFAAGVLSVYRLDPVAFARNR